MRLYELCETRVFENFSDYLVEWDTRLGKKAVKVWYNIDTQKTLELDPAVEHHTQAVLNNPELFDVPPDLVKRRSELKINNDYNRYILDSAFRKNWIRIFLLMG